MTNIQLKPAIKVQPGEYILVPLQASGVVVAHKIVKVVPLDDGKWLELTTEETDNISTGRVHLVRAKDTVVVVVVCG